MCRRKNKKNKPLSYDLRHHSLTLAIIRHFHLQYLRGRSDLVLNHFRYSFYIPDDRSTVKEEIKACMICARYQVKPITKL